MSSLSEIYTIVKELPKTLSKLPTTIVNAMKKAAGDIVGVVKPLAMNIKSLRQPFDYTGQLIGYIAKESAAVSSEGGKLRLQLKTYFAGVEDCIAQTNELAKAVGGNLPPVGANPSFADELIDNVLGKISDVALLPVAKALNSRPGWETQPNANARLIEELIKKVTSEDSQDEYEVNSCFLTALTTMKMADGVLKLIIKLLPRDLSAGLQIVGEGGSLTLTGHPLAWVFVIGSFVLDEIQTLLAACQKSIALQKSLARV